MKDKEELKEDAGFVRDLVALVGIDYPTNFERDLRDGMFRKAFTLVSTMETVHIRRLNESLCEMEFPTPAALALRQAVMVKLAQHHDLKKYRKVNMPTIEVPTQAPAKN
jgi:hypothetical protein